MKNLKTQEKKNILIDRINSIVKDVVAADSGFVHIITSVLHSHFKTGAKTINYVGYNKAELVKYVRGFITEQTTVELSSLSEKVLKNILENLLVQFDGEALVNEISEGTVRLCAHNIKWSVNGKGFELSEIDEEHITNMLSENIVQGELCLTNENGEEARGWWQIQK